MLLETPLHPQKVTVWCGFHAGGVIGPYFFVDENDRHITVNGERYRAMLEDYLWPKLDKLDINDMWFLQDGATSHTARVTIDLLKGKFGERVISRNGPVEWPPYQVTGLCQQASNFRRPQRQHPTRNCQRSGRNVCQSGGKLGLIHR